MDTSEQYIKMCEKAAEIQGLWKPVNGDFCWHDNEGEEAFGVWEFPAQISVVSITKETEMDWWYHWLWLPRQDQLQEMISNTYTPFEQTFELLTFCLVDGHICTHIGYEQTAYSNQFTSMEQLWLAFVMSERGKKWDGEKWIKQ